MKTDEYGRVSLSEPEIFEALYNGQLDSLEKIFVDSPDAIEQFNRAREENTDHISKLTALPALDISVAEFDQQQQAKWFIPDEYKNFDIAQWLLEQCKTDQERDRVVEELELFIQHNMIEVLQYLKYLVDTMRKNQVVWGVGRGSSVASYCLYLLGVHRVNSLKFDLDIKEFLR